MNRSHSNRTARVSPARLPEGARSRLAAAVLILGLCPGPFAAPTDAQSMPEATGNAVGAPGFAGAGARRAPTNMAGVYAFTQAPAGFDAREASPDELARHGYPPRPDGAGPEALAKWQSVTKPTLRRIVPVLVRTQRYHRPVSGLHVDDRNSTASSYNWSGYAVVGRAGAAPLYSAAGNWTVPTVQQPFGVCSGGWDYSSQWAGIDGFSNGYLLQAGSEADAYCDVGSQVTEYYPWLEWLPSKEIALYVSINPRKLPPFYPGDYVLVQVWASRWTRGASQTGNLLYTDLTQNWQISLTFSAASVGGSKVVGQSADWIVERPTVGGTLSNLANFTANPWVLVFAQDLNQFSHTPAAPLNATAYNTTMFDDFGLPISSVTLYGNSALWFYNEGSAR